jgi:hypothetical protein
VEKNDEQGEEPKLIGGNHFGGCPTRSNPIAAPAYLTAARAGVVSGVGGGSSRKGEVG